MFATSNGRKLRHSGAEVFRLLDCRCEPSILELDCLLEVGSGHAPDVSPDQVVRTLHRNGKLFLMVVQQRSIGNHNEGDLESKRL
jgi:hypothetical protein